MTTPIGTMASIKFKGIGTVWEIETSRPIAPDLRHGIRERVEEFDAVYSRFRLDSLVARLAATSGGGRVTFPDESAPLFDLYDQLHLATGGALDPLVGSALELLGYDRHYSLVPASPAIRQEERLRRAVWSRDVMRDGSTLTVRRPVVMDVGAAGKGHLVDILSRLLLDAGFADVMVDGSGDMRHVGDKGIDVGLEHPFDPGRVIGIARLENRALCASATNRRVWGDGIHHVVDARTGMPVRDVVATWVVADSALVADGLATALFFVDADQLQSIAEFAHVRMFADGRVEASPAFDGELFI